MQQNAGLKGTYCTFLRNSQRSKKIKNTPFKGKMQHKKALFEHKKQILGRGKNASWRPSRKVKWCKTQI